MIFIDGTYFVDTILVAGRGESVIASELTRYIDRYERTFLIKCLGVEFFNFMQLHATDARFLALINGADYASPEMSGRWEGFKNAQKVSPIANYVYWFYTRDHNQATTGTGTTKNQNQNSEIQSSIQKMVTAWSDMRKMLTSLYQYLYVNQEIYPEFDIDHTDKFKTINIYNL